MNLERRIKKHIHGKPQSVRISCVKGMESLAEEEVRSLLDTFGPGINGQPEFIPDAGALRVRNLSYPAIQFLVPRLRSASDIFLLIASQRCVTPKDLAGCLSNIQWPMFVKQPVRARVRSFKSALYHEGLIKKVLQESLKLHKVDISDAVDAPRLDVVVRRDQLTVEIGLAGRPLHQRDYKLQLISKAPLQSHVAYGCVASFFRWSEQKDIRSLVIPFAGSGTLGFEAVLYLLDAFPGLWRDTYGIQMLPFFKEEMWSHYKVAAPKSVPHLQLRFIEVDSQQAAALRQNCNRFFQPFDNKISWSVVEQDAFKTKEVNEQVVFMNPPYGERLENAKDFFPRLQQWIKRQSGSGFLLIPEPDSVQLSQDSRPNQQTEFQTGGRFTHLWMWQS